MGRKRRINTLSEHNIAARGKGGFTLAELVVVLAIVAIVSAMIVSFSVSMKEFSTSNKEEYDFLEDCAVVKEELYKWIAERDEPSADFSDITGDQGFTVSNGTIDLGGKQIDNLHTISKIKFVIQDNLIKCEITRVGSDSADKSFVFALRCAN